MIQQKYRGVTKTNKQTKQNKEISQHDNKQRFEAFTLAALWTDGMQSPPRLKLAVIAPVDEDILVRSSHFHLLYFFIFIISLLIMFI